MIDDPAAPKNAAPEPDPGRRRFLGEAAGILALGALAAAPGPRDRALGALRGRWRALRLGDARPRRAPGVTVRQDGAELVVSIPGADPGVALNPTAAHVFLACDGGRTVDAIAASLCRAYRVSPRTARADAGAVVSALTRAGCLVLA